MKSQLLILIVLVIFAQAKLPTDKVGITEYRQEALETLSEIFQDQNLIGTRLPLILSTTYIKDALSKSPSKLDDLQCEKIIKKTDLQETTLVEKYTLAFIASNFCNELKSNNKILSFQQDFEKALQSDNLLDIYYGFQGLSQFNQENIHTDKLKNQCLHLSGFLSQDGSAKLSKKSNQSSYTLSPLVFELYETCMNLSTEHSYLNKYSIHFKVPLASVFENSFEVSQSQIAILEDSNNTLETTIRMLNVGKSLYSGKYNKYLGEFEHDFRSKYEVPMVKFIKSQEENQLSHTEKYHLIKLYKTHKDTPYLTVRAMPILGTKKYTEVQFRWENLLGEVLPNQEKLNSYLNIQLRDRSQTLVEKKLQIENNDKNDQWTYKIKIDTQYIGNNLGNYWLEFDNNKQQEFQWTFKERIYLVTKTRCDDLSYEISSDEKTPSEFSNRLKENEKILMPHEVSGDKNFLHFKFRLDFDRDVKIVPKNVGVVLVHPLDGRIGKIVQAQYDSLNDIYRVKINLADQANLLPYNYQYEARLIVSDQRLRENIEWQFAKFKVTYKNPRQDGLPSDLHYAPLGEIHHQFREAPKQANIIIVLFFCGVIATVFLVYMAVLGSLKVNSDQMPSSGTGKLANLGFQVGIVVVLLVLLAFWIEINLYQLTIVTLAGFVPFYIIGRYALSHIQEQTIQTN